jgi:transposase-like protein
MKKVICFLLALSLAPTWIHAASEPVDKVTAEKIVALKKTYPLETCVVSGEKMGGAMGAPVDHLHQEKVNGKESERLVRFCCKGCLKAFQKEPAKHLKIIDDAAAKKEKTT